MSQSLPVRCHELAEGLISCGKSEYALLLLDAAINSKSGNKNIIELYAKCIEKKKYKMQARPAQSGHGREGFSNK